MAEVHIRSIVLGKREGLLPMLGCGGRMTMVPDHKLVLVGKTAKSFELFVLFRNLGGNSPAAQCLGQPEDVIEFVVGHFEYPIHFYDLDQNTCGLIFFSKLPDAIHGDRLAPFRELFSSGCRAGGGGGTFGGGLARHPKKGLHRLRP